jgi:hypothetical protein
VRARRLRMDHRENRGIVRRRGALDGLGMRAAWGRGELRWEGARGPRKARGRLGCRGGWRWRAVAGAGAAGGRSAVIYSECPCLTVIFSQNLNRSAQCGQQENCRSHYPLQLSQKSYNVFLNGFCRNVVPTLNAGLSL